MALKAFLCLAAHLHPWETALAQMRAFQEQKEKCYQASKKPTFLYFVFSLNKKIK